MIRRRWQVMVAGPAALAMLVGCSPQGPGGGGTSAPSSAVPAGPPVTLRLADAEAQGRSSQPWIDRFIDEVDSRSGGRITIEPIYKAGGGNVDSPGESIVAGQVMAGEVELALVPVRAWGDVGVTSLQALGAPLLIDSDELLTAVAADPLIQPLLDGMLDHGVIGLSAWPDDLRHPFAWEKNGSPFLKASDLKGATVLTLVSKLQSMILEGLGAMPVTATILETDSMIADGSLHGAESSFGAASTLGGTPTGTGDVVLYPKYQVLAADDAAFSRLTAAQQEIVRGAASAARDLALTNHVPDAQLAKDWCAYGGRVVLAGDANVATFRHAAEPIVTKLAEDPLTATAIEAIRALKARITPTPVEACEPGPNQDGPWPSVAPGPPLTLLPDGVYVHSVSRAELIAAGAEGNDLYNAATWTLTVTGDNGKYVARPDDGRPDETFSLEFELLGDRVRFQLTDGPDYFDIRWELDGSDLSLDVVASNSLISGQSNTARAHSVLNTILGGAWVKVE